MKKVNFNPELELKKAKIMEQFDQNNGPEEVDAHADNKNLGVEPGSDPGAQLVAEEDLTEEALRERVIDALKTVYDPEIPVNIYDLGLIYKVDIKDRFVDVDMTLTAPGCPVAATFPGMVEHSINLVPGVNGAAVELVWDPPWTPELISEAARLELGLI